MASDVPFVLKSETTISVVESYLEWMAAASPCDLQLPSEHIKSAGFGGESALIQFVLTWARQNPTGLVHTPMRLGDTKSDEHALKHLSNRAYSFVALLAAHDVLAADGRTSIRTLTNHACSLRVDAMAKGLRQAAFGHRTFLACVDHSTKAFIPAFYFSDSALGGFRKSGH